MDTNQGKPTLTKLLQKAILTDGSRYWLGFIGFGVSLLMILAASLIWQWSAEVLKPKASQAGYLVISKPVNLANSLGLGSSAISANELSALRAKPFTKQVIPFTAANFSAFASASLKGENLSTALFFEAIPDDLLDVLPSDFRWETGSSTLPIILGRDFLNLYNYGFATSQGLPQLSADAIGLFGFKVTVSGPKGQQNYNGRIVGFSDRVNSILVPKSFLDWANQHVGDGIIKPANRAMLQVKSGDDPDIAYTLQNLGLTANQDILRLSLAGETAQQASKLIGIMALLFMALAVSQLIMGQQLTLAAKHQEISILQGLGFEASHFVVPLVRPFAIRLGMITIVLAFAVQFAQSYLQTNYGLPNINQWSAFVLAGLFLTLIVGLNGWALKRKIELG